MTTTPLATHPIDQVLMAFAQGDVPTLLNVIADDVDFRIDHYRDDADVAWHNDQAEEVDSRREAASEVAHLLQQLRGDDRRVVELRYGLGGGPCLTQQAVAVELGISESTVRRRERSALAVLRRRTEATMAA